MPPPDAAQPLPPGLGRALTAFERHLTAERGLSQHTVRAYLGDVTALLQHVSRAGGTELGQLDIQVLRSWLAAQHAAGQAKASVARRAAAARAFTAFAHAGGELSDDAGRLLGTPRTGRHLPQVLGREQMSAVLAAPAAPAAPVGPMDPQDEGDPGGPPGSAPSDDGAGLMPRERAVARRDQAIMELLYATGIRVSKLCGLDVGDLDEERRTIRVMGKGGKERIVPVGSYALKAVEDYLVRGRPALAAAGKTGVRGGALFLNVRGGTLSRQSAWAILRAAAERAGVDENSVSPHTLRHSFATHLLDGGADVRVVQELLGHASVTTTQVYTLVTVEKLREVYASSHPRALN
jgi:site-specific recombinase XerD